MLRKRGKAGRITLAGAATLVLGAAAGCSVGQGAPDGWRYLRHGPVAVALPKTWRPTADGARLPGVRGRTDAALTVGAATGPAARVPADARRQHLTIDGRAARVFSYARPAPDGRPAGHVEVRVPDVAGRPLTLRAWAVDGTAHDPALLAEIVNGIEFPGSAMS
jgi:hypothetical protein